MTNMKHIYRSIAAYNHEVFKYSGMVKQSELAFWKEHIRTHGVTDNNNDARVLVFAERPGNADRITYTPEWALLPHPSLTYCEGGIYLVTMR